MRLSDDIHNSYDSSTSEKDQILSRKTRSEKKSTLIIVDPEENDENIDPNIPLTEIKKPSGFETWD